MFFAPKFLGEGPRIYGPGLSNRSRLWSHGKVSWRSAEGARRSCVWLKKTRNMVPSKLEAARRPKSDWKYNFMGLVGRVKIWGASAPRGRNIVSRPVGWVNMRAYNFLVGGPKFTKFFSPHRGWNAVDEVLFRFSIYCSVPEKFAIKLESCYKSRWILDVFYPAKFCRGHPCKTSVHFITPAISHIPW